MVPKLLVFKNYWFLQPFQLENARVLYKIKRKFAFFSVLRTRENSDVFNSLDEIYLAFTSKKANILYIFLAQEHKDTTGWFSKK